MRAKSQFSINIKLIIFCFFFILLLLLIASSSFSSSSPISSQTHITNFTNPTNPCPSSSIPFIPSCTKIPPSLSLALIHYAASNITPQQTFKEISVTLKVLEKKSPCNFLVFGLGHDSLMWTSLNHGGRTVFLEEDRSWIDQVTKKIPTLESYHVTYDTKVHQADKLFEIGQQEDCKVVTDPRFSKCKLALKDFPSDIYNIDWDLIMVDAPTGYHEDAPGRMNAIFTAGLMARNKENGDTDVFVHDVDRNVEDQFSKGLLCEGYLIEQEGRLRHFNIPSHRTGSARSFCP